MGYRNYSTSVSHIVDATGQGDFTTVQAAINAASTGQTVFIRPGTYTENPVLKAGVNLTAFGCDGINLNSSTLLTTGHVIISGKVSMTTAGYSVLDGITLQTNSDYCLAVTGTAASNVVLNNCTIVANNHDAISLTSSSSSANIFFQLGNTTITSAGFKLYNVTSPGSLSFYYSSNAQTDATSSTNSAGVVTMEYVNGNTPMTTSANGSVAVVHCDIDAANTPVLTTAGTGQSTIRFSSLISGTASTVSVGNGTIVNMNMCTVNSSNTNAITGTGTLNYSGIDFNGTSNTINVTTQTGGLLQGGVFQAPSAGFIGEQIRSTANGSITNATPGNITSISLTPGSWDVSAVANYAFTTSASATTTGLSITSATFTGTQGDDFVNFINSFTTNSQVAIAIPSRRITLTATTTYYLVQEASFVGTATCFGRISATRVG